MIKSFPALLLISAFLLVSAPIALAQTPDSTVTVSTTTTVTDPLTSEELTDTDLTADLAAEALPTTNRFTYRWEIMRNGLQRLFTFKAADKALLYERHLHTLDRKLAACAEIGDEKCTELIEARMQKLSTRATNYIARREELRDQLLDNFQTWRERREALIATRQERATQLQAKHDELMTARKAALEEARQNRAARQQAIKENIQEHREQIKENIEQRQADREQLRQEAVEQQQLNQEQRQQNQEQLIQLRSGNLKNKLDATREQVDTRQQENLELLQPEVDHQ